VSSARLEVDGVSNLVHIGRRPGILAYRVVTIEFDHCHKVEKE
jgi:hypothetical protein